MKRFLVFLVALSFTSCATVQQNIDARTYLAKCQYEFAGIQVTDVQFSSGILVDSVDFAVKIKITDPTDRDVALDHAELAFFLDKNHVLDLDHRQFLRIAAKTSAVEPVTARLPFAGIIKTLGHRPEILGVKAKLWVTLLVGKDTWQTPLVIPVEVEVPIPYHQIDDFIAQKRKQLEDDAAANAKKAAADQAAKAAEAAKNALPSVQLPHF